VTETPLNWILLHVFIPPKARKASSKAQIVALINDYNPPREVIATQWRNELDGWDTLLPRMPLTALVRDLGEMTAVGLVKPFSTAANLMIRKLGDEVLLKRARIHTLAVLTAQEAWPG
jgi:60 kDa SS-A/Ro ribonucleoprotein